MVLYIGVLVRAIRLPRGRTARRVNARHNCRKLLVGAVIFIGHAVCRETASDKVSLPVFFGNDWVTVLSCSDCNSIGTIDALPISMLSAVSRVWAHMKSNWRPLTISARRQGQPSDR